MNDHVHIAVIHYRTPELLERCLTALVTHAPGASITLVDTDPHDETFARARALVPNIEVISPPNHSYAHSVNVGLAGRTEQYLVQMNADVFIDEFTLPALINTAKLHGDRAIVAPRLHGEDRRAQNMGPLYALNYARLAFTAEPYTHVSWLSGAMQLIPNAVFTELGGYDEGFRFTNEDIEFSWRANKRGIPSVLVDTSVTHVGGASTPTSPAFFLEGRRGSYLLTERYYGEFAARVHRMYLHLEARLGPVFTSRNAALTSALRAQADRLADGTFSITPFGVTLSDHNY